jgi:hypothetical protein
MCGILSRNNYFRLSWNALLVSSCLLFLVQCASGPRPNTTLDTVLAKQESSQNHIEQYNQQILTAAGRLWQPPEYTLNEEISCI